MWRKGLLGRAANHRLALELSETAKLVSPMVVTQLGQIVMLTTDLALIGRIGVDALAAAALAGRIYFVSITFAAGPLAAIAPLAAQAFAVNNLGVVRRSLRMGLWAAPLLSLPMVAFGFRGEQILLSLDLPHDAARLAHQYLSGLAWGMAPALWFYSIRNFMAAVNRPGPLLWITLIAPPLNALLAYLLIYGKLGLPRLELFGAGLATTIVNCGTFSASLCVAVMRRPFRHYRVLGHFWQFDWSMLRRLFAIGMPISVTWLIVNGSFSVATLLAGLISTTAVAAHQIAVQVAAILVMIPLAISMAAVVRVGNAVGRNDSLGAKRAGLVATLLSIVVGATLTVGVVAARFEIAEFVFGESGGDADATIRLAADLLLVGASFYIPDAVANVLAGTLRGLTDTRVPVLFAGIAYWLIGLSVSYVLGLKIGLGAIGIWIGLCSGTIIYAGLLAWRFQLLTSRRALHRRNSIA
ncbi:MATE family efflux transporter [Bradyrhizobium sp. DASA03005]|uniref:MATE family efflux transporter n=1 Tax=Bradyrhizobium sp. SPXBL-02 TaxID=3395912 RepID=UPI003F70C02C